MKELQEMFGVDQGELFQTFLCVLNYKQKGFSFKQIMDNINSSSTVHSNVIQFFAVVGFLSISGKIERMINDEANKLNG